MRHIINMDILQSMHDLKDMLINASKCYYAYLEANNLGLNDIPIHHIEQKDSELIIALKGFVGDMDLKLSAALMLKVGDNHYAIGEGEALEALFFDEKQKVLYLSISLGILATIKEAIKTKAHFALFSDMKFLVKNVEEFFTKFGENLALPLSFSDEILNNDIKELPHLSKEQNNALKMVLTSPLCYVWGPPGTGKTQAVLFEALLHYIREGKRVAVIATTNNALEQVLKSLIKQFDALGLERSVILRLGTPTMQYLSAYSETCDPSILQQKGATNLFSAQDNLKTRLKNAFVVGVTLDGFIKRYESLELSFHHIFLDECAYAPLIKSIALCVESSPLALFGDHKQLMPVCEMPLKELDKEANHSAYVWNLSSLFLEPIFSGANAYDLAKRHESSNVPDFSQTKLCTLSKTHRYGDNLAHILDKYIYHIGLQGNGAQMELYALDSGAKRESEAHISETEANMCVNLSVKLGSDEYAIITPFVKQRALISRKLPRAKVFTIHGSQGQEFDSVIFSPVGLHFFLTNSMQTNALYALNVAISRIKKRLFIVCDYAFWQRQQGQLIWAILQDSKLIKI